MSTIEETLEYHRRTLADEGALDRAACEFLFDELARRRRVMETYNRVQREDRGHVERQALAFLDLAAMASQIRPHPDDTTRMRELRRQLLERGRDARAGARLVAVMERAEVLLKAWNEATALPGRDPEDEFPALSEATEELLEALAALKIHPQPAEEPAPVPAPEKE